MMTINTYTTGRKSVEEREELKRRRTKYKRYEQRQIEEEEKEYTMEEALTRIKRLVNKEEESINP